MLIVKDDLYEIKKENIEVKICSYLNIINLYLRYLTVYPKEKKVRKQIFNLMKGFFSHLKYEEEILKRLENARISQEDFDDIILSLESLYYIAADYYHDILLDFETTLSVGDFDRVIYRKPEEKYLNEEKKELMIILIEKLEKQHCSKIN